METVKESEASATETKPKLLAEKNEEKVRRSEQSRY